MQADWKLGQTTYFCSEISPGKQHALCCSHRNRAVGADNVLPEHLTLSPLPPPSWHTSFSEPTLSTYKLHSSPLGQSLLKVLPTVKILVHNLHKLHTVKPLLADTYSIADSALCTKCFPFIPYLRNLRLADTLTLNSGHIVLHQHYH